MTLEGSCAEPGAGLDDPCESLPTQGIVLFLPLTHAGCAPAAGTGEDGGSQSLFPAGPSGCWEGRKGLDPIRSDQIERIPQGAR